MFIPDHRGLAWGPFSSLQQVAIISALYALLSLLYADFFIELE